MFSPIVGALLFTVGCTSPPAMIYACTWWYLYSKTLMIDDLEITEEDLIDG